MGRFYQIFIPLLSLFLVRVDLTDLFPLHIKVEVVKIHDGDTVLVRHGSYEWKLRFSKIDSPELGQRFRNSRLSAGEFSKNCLKRLIDKEKTLVLKIENRDQYGRVLGDLNDLSLKLIREGCTTLYPHAVFSSVGEKHVYLKALKKAKASKRGLWKYSGFEQPKIWRKINKQYGYRQSRQ